MLTYMAWVQPKHPVVERLGASTAHEGSYITVVGWEQPSFMWGSFGSWAFCTLQLGHLWLEGMGDTLMVHAPHHRYEWTAGGGGPSPQV
jgi:hypothetical protein